MLDKYLDFLNEAGKRTSITRITRATKIERAKGALATKYAKEVNDPMYARMIKFREKFHKFRKRIKDKYGPRVRSRAIQGKGLKGIVFKKNKK